MPRRRFGVEEESGFRLHSVFLGRVVLFTLPEVAPIWRVVLAKESLLRDYIKTIPPSGN